MKQRMGEERPNIKLNGWTLEAFRKFYYLNNKIEAKGGTNDSVSATKKGMDGVRLGELEKTMQS